MMARGREVMMDSMMEACLEGVICSVCGSEIGENEEYVWSDEQEDYICMNCHEEECADEDEDYEDDDYEDDEIFVDDQEVTSFLNEYYLIYPTKLPNSELF
jgi:hypothetical protein